MAGMLVVGDLVVGDRATVLRNRPCSSPLSVGQIVVVVECPEFNTGGTDVFTVVEDGKLGPEWLVHRDHLEKIEMTESPETNPLYSYRASDELTESAWEVLVKAVNVSTCWEDVKAQFFVWEKEYKDTTGLPIPGAWRSAKSVIKGAMQHDVPLMTGLDVRGKTSVELEIKSRKPDKDELAPEEQLDKMLKKAVEFAAQHNLDVVGRFENILDGVSGFVGITD